jgi:hypothetical protein
MAKRRVALLERTTGRQMREALLEAGSHLGWDQWTVVQISEAVTGRAWQRCGPGDIVRVAKVLLQIATALRSGSGRAAYDLDVAANLDGRDVARQRSV